MTQTIEHFVLFKVKPDTHISKISLMLNNLTSLTSLPQILHLSATPISKTNSPFTHLLHSRYKTKEDLYSYSAHPDHVKVVQEYVKPIIDDIMAVDWVCEADSQVGLDLKPGLGVKVMFFKVKEGEKDGLFEFIGGLKEKYEVVSFGENFSPERAKGFGFGCFVVGKEFDVEMEKVGGLVEEVLVFDYSVPQLASL